MWFVYLPFIDISVFWPGIIFLGFIIGFLSGFLGTGGGFLLTPVLRFIFGIPYAIAIGSGLSTIAVTAVFGTWKHFKYNHIKIKLGLILFSGSLVGVALGTRLLVFIRDTEKIQFFGYSISFIDLIISLCYMVLLITAAVLMFTESGKYGSNNSAGQANVRDLSTYRICFFWSPINKISFQNINENKDSLNISFLIITGFIVGFLAGLLGVGGGFIMTPIMICVFRIPAAVAIGTDLFQIALTSFSGALAHTTKGNVDFLLTGLILCGSMAGSQLGASLTGKFRGRKIRLYFAYFLLFSAIFILSQFFLNILKK